MGKSILIILAVLCCFSASGQGRRSFFFAKQDAVAAGGNPTIVNSAKGVAGAGHTADVTISPTAGNLLVMCVSSDAAAVSWVSNNVTSGDTQWTKAIDTNYNSSGFVAIWYCKSVPSGVTSVRAASVTGDYLTAIIHECSGCSASAPFTAGEINAIRYSSNTTNPQVGPLSNATANSIFFAAITSNDNQNPSTLTINGTGTVGTWNLYSSGNSQDLDAIDNQIISAPNIVVSSTTSETHGWTTANGLSGAVIACFH